MSFEQYLAFLFASTLFLLVPGPTIILVVSKASSHGKRAALPLATGVVLGDAVAMCCSLLGLGAVLATSALLFNILKWVGACYLVYLGIRMWRKDESKSPRQHPVGKQSSLMRTAFIVTVLNPKSIAFYLAFLPQFIRPEGSLFWQLLLLGGSFLALAWCNALAYGLLAGRLLNTARQGLRGRLLHRLGGGALIGAGILTAAVRR